MVTNAPSTPPNLLELRPQMATEVLNEAVDPAVGHMARLMARFQDCQPPDVRLADNIQTAIVPPGQLLAVCRFLSDDPHMRYSFLAELNAVDHLERADRFDITYILHSFDHNSRLRLKTRVGGEDPTVPSVAPLWPAASWHEREIFDLFGVKFSGHPDLRRLFLPEDWEGYPLRRDEAQGEEPVSFTEDEAGRERGGPVLHRTN
ncbi:MAG: NADH-quinone oxidoreductase subunit C [Dehalococcoidia bacterium]|nr:NADH-quinone oxidoreductase subunit C [Dehalococcoidia bacterium]